MCMFRSLADSSIWTTGTGGWWACSSLIHYFIVFYCGAQTLANTTSCCCCCCCCIDIFNYKYKVYTQRIDTGSVFHSEFVYHFFFLFFFLALALFFFLLGVFPVYDNIFFPSFGWQCVVLMQGKIKCVRVCVNESISKSHQIAFYIDDIDAFTCIIMCKWAGFHLTATQSSRISFPFVRC